MKTAIFIIAFLLSPIIFYAQSYEEVVYLKNGSIIRGLIIEEIPKIGVKIKTRDLNVFVYNYDEIEKITKEFDENKLSSESKVENDDLKVEGFYFASELSYGVGFGKYTSRNNFEVINSNSYNGLKMIGGYRINEFVAIGAGMGIENYMLGVFIPTSLDFRFNLSSNKLSPILNTNIGYRFDSNGRNEGGVFNIGLGAQYKVVKNTLYFATIGIKYQSELIATSIQQNFFSQNVNENHNWTYITISTGFAF